MNTHKVTLNGQVVAVARDHFKLITMVCSLEHHDEDGKGVTTHELVMEGVDPSGREVTKFAPRVPLKKGDLIQIMIGETDDAAA